MRRAMLITLILCSICSFSHAAIEIYVAGKKYNSIQDYKNSRRHILNGPLKLKGPIAEPRQVPFMSKSERQNLEKISYNSGVSHVVVDFQQNWQNPQPRFIVNADELQDAIRDTVSSQHQAALIISNPKKMRILSLKAGDGQNH